MQIQGMEVDVWWRLNCAEIAIYCGMMIYWLLKVVPTKGAWAKSKRRWPPQ